MFGFTYNGIHSSEFGLYYTQSAEDKWFSDPEYEVYDEDVSWRNGGYYYGSKVKVRVFTIKCLFEEIDIETRQRIKQWLRRDTKGTLIFDDMPFVYWNVRPGKIPVGNWYVDTDESYSGTVDITFNAYEPFGYLIRRFNSASSPDDGAENYCNLISEENMPDAPTTSSTSFDIYNPGTEECGLSIEISGSTSNHFRFMNETNGTKCEFSSLPPDDLHVRIDGETGFVAVFQAGAIEFDNGFAYHDKGVVKLAPCIGYDDVLFRYNGLNGNVYSFDLSGIRVTDELKNAKLKISGMQDVVFTITAINIGNNRVYCTKSGSGNPPENGQCDINTLNHIVIQEYTGSGWETRDTLNLSYILTDYYPMVL